MKPVARLSIFNSRTLKEMPKPTPALWLALAILAAVRVAMFFSSDVLLFSPQDEQRYYAFRNDARYLEDGRPQPRALVLGTSRLTALDSEYVSEPLRLARGEVLNYSVPSLTFWHIRKFLERNPDVTENVDVLIVDLLPFQLSQGDIFSHEAPYFVEQSTMADMWSTGSPRSVFIKAADTVWPAWSERRRVPEWIATAHAALGDDEHRRSAFLHYQKPFRAIQKRRQAVGLSAIQAYTSDELSPVQLRALHAIPELLPEDATLVLMWIPVSGPYRRELNGMGAAGHNYRNFKKSIMEFRSPKVHQVWVESPEAIGIRSGEFLDEVHFGEAGMARIGAFLESQLVEIRGNEP
jgi:hypothetical protein